MRRGRETKKRTRVIQTRHMFSNINASQRLLSLCDNDFTRNSSSSSSIVALYLLVVPLEQTRPNLSMDGIFREFEDVIIGGGGIHLHLW